MVLKCVGASSAKVVIKIINWILPLFAPSVTDDARLSKRKIIENPTEPRYKEGSVIVECLISHANRFFN